MNAKTITFVVCGICSAMAFAEALPVVSEVEMTQTGSRTATITYSLANAPAVVTVDIETNFTENGEVKWASIGGANIQNVSGDVFKRVDANGQHTIKWHPDLSWRGHAIPDGGARAVVSAWALDNTPDYVVFDISAGAQPNTQRYYPTAEYLPGGLLANNDYRTTSLVLRKIVAKDVTWTMGSVGEDGRDDEKEATHKVTLTNNYYIGVFQITQAQWSLIQAKNPWPSKFIDPATRGRRPVEQVCYNEIRCAIDQTSNSKYLWPNDPCPDSFLGKLRTKTGVLFDLPSEAQWEFACRAGNGDCRWNDGSRIVGKTRDSNLPGRYTYNGGYVDGTTQPAWNCSEENGTAIVGSYAPNSWGVYDMHGNVCEWCLDWRSNDITGLNGAINIKYDDPTVALNGTDKDKRIIRGGGWEGTDAYMCRSAFRNQNTPESRSRFIGFRVYCQAGLK